jgi:hypothetical protein
MNPVIVVINSPDCAGGEASEAMEHHEAVETMAAERYLLGELTPELRDAYEDHLFGCVECAADIKLGAAFIDHAKDILPGLSMTAAAELPASPRQPVKVVAPEANAKRNWFAWLRPAILQPRFMVPAFACLLAIVAYQNVAVIPGLEMAASEPRLLPTATVLAGETRGGLPIVYADLITGSTITVPLTQSRGQGTSYASYRFDFYDSKGKLVWTRTLPVAETDDTASIWLPGRVRQDSYKLAVTGITASGENIALQQQIFELRLKK